MTDIQGIIFDKDGTLFDFQATWGAWARAFLMDVAQGDSERAAELGAAVGYNFGAGSFAPDSPVIAGTPGEIAGHLLPHLPGANPLSLVSRMNAHAAEAPMAEAVPLSPLIAALRGAGLRIGLATNDAEVPARAHLSAAGVEGDFDFIAGCDSGHGAKPGPGQLLAFADSFGLDPARVVMVGDSRHDLLAARAAGMRGVAVLTGMARAEDLAPFCEVVLPHIGHLPAWIAAHPACTELADSAA